MLFRSHPTPVFLPGEPHGRRSLVGYSPQGHKESDTTERLPFHFSLSCIGQGYLPNPGIEPWSPALQADSSPLSHQGSPIQLFAIPWTVAHQAPPSMGFSRQEYWSGLPFPSPCPNYAGTLRSESETQRKPEVPASPRGEALFRCARPSGLCGLHKAASQHAEPQN